MAISGIGPVERVLREYIPNLTYRLTRTNYTARVETEDVSIIWSDRYIGPGLMALIGRTRAVAKKRFVEGLVAEVDWKPKFSGRSNFYRKVAAREIDLSRAYLSAAVKIGALDVRMAGALMKCSKGSRLMAIGSLATVRRVTEVSEGIHGSTKMESDAETTEVWNRIIAEVDRTMNDLSKTAGDDFLFYWTDAVFVRGEGAASNRVVARAAKLGYETHGGKKVWILPRREGASTISVDDGRKFFMAKRAKV